MVDDPAFNVGVVNGNGSTSDDGGMNGSTPHPPTLGNSQVTHDAEVTEGGNTRSNSLKSTPRHLALPLTSTTSNSKEREELLITLDDEDADGQNSQDVHDSDPSQIASTKPTLPAKSVTLSHKEEVVS